MAKSVWKVDTSHSSVDFTVKHMMFSKVKGTFTEFDAEIEADPDDLTTANIRFTVNTGSVDTRSSDRDNHLRSADFFDSENHPQMIFQSTNIVKKGEGQYDVTGDLTILGSTRQETFSVSSEGVGTNPWGVVVAGFSVEGAISRKEFGLTWNAALETGGVLVGDEVKISLEIQAQKQ